MEEVVQQHDSFQPVAALLPQKTVGTLVCPNKWLTEPVVVVRLQP